jgi:hypothetical protein
MRILGFFVLFCTIAQVAASQTIGDVKPSLPKDPGAVFASAAPFYNFSDPSLKPWHMKASYQLYDENERPSSQGTFEYWWLSPKVYRSSWTRPGSTHSDWHTADGKYAYQTSGESLNYFEYKLQSMLLSPLPDSNDLAPDEARLERQAIGKNDDKIPCITVIPKMTTFGSNQVVPLGIFPTYCFDSQLPAVQAIFSVGSVTTVFGKIAMMNGKYLARQVDMLEGKRKILTASVDSVTGLSPSDPALVPSPEALAPKTDKIVIDATVMTGALLKKQMPVYPQDAKDAHVSGKVILKALIGRDGGIHSLHVVSTPWPSLAASSLWAVSHWKYKPYLLNGEPVDVETTVNVIFSLGG